MELLLIRHGATAGNLERRYIGRTDEPLCEAGRARLLALKSLLPVPDRLICSPMLRARQSASILFPGMEFTVCGDLRETDFGRFEGKTADELSEDPDYRAWVDTGCTGPIPAGEDVLTFKARTCGAFRRLAAALPEGGRTAFVMHGGGIMAVMECFALPKQDFYAFHIPNGAAILCTYRDGCLRETARVGTRN